MRKRPLGKTGIEVSEISFGSAALGIPYGLDVRTAEELPSDEDAARLVRTAEERGINFFDTARGYGRSEDVLGRAFEGMRERVIICTKSKSLFSDDGSLLKGSPLKRAIDTSMRESLSALRTDYVDVFLIHRVTDEVSDSQEVADVFREIKRQGAARAIGVSTYGANLARRAGESGNWDVIQIAYNLMDQTHAAVLPLAAKHGVGVMVRSVLLKGILGDKEPELHEVLKPVGEHRRRYLPFLSADVPTLVDLAVKFVLAHTGVSSALMGIDRMEYLERALAVADGNYLDETTLASVRKEAYPDPEFLNLPLWDRKGWLH